MRVRVTISGPGGQSDRAPEFSKAEITIGRRPTNDIVIPDASASGAHARVMLTGGALTILDLDSTNGTAVNSEPLQGPRLLDDGDVVEIGDFRLKFALNKPGGTVASHAPEHSGDHGADYGGDPGVASPSQAEVGPAADWPAPPPMMDNVQAAAPTAIASAVVVPADPRRGKPSPKLEPEQRSAMFPRLELSAPSTPPAPPTPTRTPAPSRARGGYEFQPAAAPVVLNRAFRSVWLRMRNAIKTATAGAREQVAEALDQALLAAAAVSEVGDTARLKVRMLEEMVADGPLPNLLAGDPDEVLLAGTSRVRISRGGHVSEGASPFTCEAAISCWVDRVCSAPGGDAKFPLKGAFGAYSVRAVGGASGMVVSLRRASSQGPATLEALVRGGVLSHGIAALLSACVVSRLNVLVCAGPGSNAEALLAALMACAPPTELQVVLGNAQLDAGLFQGTVVLLRRDDFGRDAIGSALSLGPDRIGVDELRWDEAAAITGVVSRSMSYILGVRANTAPLGVGLLESMLTKSAPPEVARQLLMGSVDVVLTAQLFADAVTRVTALSEPTLDDAGVLSAQDIFALVPGTRTWKYSGVTPRCFEDITRRGFPLDSSVFA